MKVIGDTFFIRKGAEGAKYEVYLNSQAKGLLPDRTLENFYYLKTPKMQFPIVRKLLLGKKQSRVVSCFIGKIYQGKRQSKKII